MKRLSKWFYLGSIVGLPILGVLLIIIALVLLVISGILTNFEVNLTYAGTEAVLVYALLILLGCAAILYGTGMWCVLLYRAWAAIQDADASTTPGKAVGYLCIPLYNFYWLFKAWYGLARDYNRFTVRNSVKAPKMKEGLFLAFCILSMCEIVLSLPVSAIENTYLIYPVSLLSFVIFAITCNETIDGVNALLTR